MIDRHYFESILPEQLRHIGLPCRLKVHTQSGAEYDVAAILSLHEAVVSFEVHGSGEEPKRNPEWQQAHPEHPAWIYDLVTVPYHTIVATYLTPKGVGTEQDASIGFRPPRPV